LPEAVGGQFVLARVVAYSVTGKTPCEVIGKTRKLPFYTPYPILLGAISAMDSLAGDRRYTLASVAVVFHFSGGIGYILWF
jgi:hypothetical protein